MNRFVASTLYAAGAKLRNPSVFAELRRLESSQWSSLDHLTAIQLDRLRTLLRQAETRSPYYQALFRSAGFQADTLKSVEDLRKLPVTTKSTLIAENARIHTGIGTQGSFTAETSGTTGISLEFTKSERWDSINRAHVMRAYAWYDVRPWERNGYLWGYNLDPAKARRVQLLDMLQNRFRLFRYDQAAVREFAMKLVGASYLSGYSSMIYETAKVLNAMGVRVPNLKLVKGTSEMILDVYQREAAQAFGCRIVSEYGAAEAGLIAFECPQGSMHINMEDVVLERSEEGEAIVTNLASDSFPIIRYALGDQVTLSESVCSCGRRHPVLQEVVGRRGATILGATGRYPALTFYYVFKNVALTDAILLNYRAYQSEAGRCRIVIEGVRNPAVEAAVTRELLKYFADDLMVELSFVSELPRGQKKAQYFESSVVAS